MSSIGVREQLFLIFKSMYSLTPIFHDRLKLQSTTDPQTI